MQKWIVIGKILDGKRINQLILSDLKGNKQELTKEEFRVFCATHDVINVGLSTKGENLENKSTVALKDIPTYNKNLAQVSGCSEAVYRDKIYNYYKSIDENIVKIPNTQLGFDKKFKKVQVQDSVKARIRSNIVPKIKDKTVELDLRYNTFTVRDGNRVLAKDIDVFQVSKYL